jgi:Family of unknown function (DUF5678)
MAEVTFAYALEVIRALSLEDQERLRQWLTAQKGKHASPLEGTQAPSDWYAREMRWLSEHQVAYAGQWVALDAERLLSHGTDARQVYAEAHAAGVAVPFVAYIEMPDEYQWGRWL